MKLRHCRKDRGTFYEIKAQDLGKPENLKSTGGTACSDLCMLLYPLLSKGLSFLMKVMCIP